MLRHLECKVEKPEEAEKWKAIYAMAYSFQEVLRPLLSKLSMPYFIKTIISLQICIFQCKYSLLCHLECKVVKSEKAENLKPKIYAMAKSIQEVSRPN